jgi:hypothetical protein
VMEKGKLWMNDLRGARGSLLTCRGCCAGGRRVQIIGSSHCSIVLSCCDASGEAIERDEALLMYAAGAGRHSHASFAAGHSHRVHTGR